jgi:hypothetical protein
VHFVEQSLSRDADQPARHPLADEAAAKLALLARLFLLFQAA